MGPRRIGTTHSLFKQEGQKHPEPHATLSGTTKNPSEMEPPCRTSITCPPRETPFDRPKNHLSKGLPNAASVCWITPISHTSEQAV